MSKTIGAAALAVSSVALVVAVLALREAQKASDDQEAYDHLPEGRVVVARGDGWTFFAWNSGGLCMSLWFGDREGGTGCGIPVVGARPRGEPGREHFVVAGASYRGLSKNDLWINGVAAANVRRVEVELADGRRLQTALYDAPAALGLDLKFFLVRTRFHVRTRWDSASKIKVPVPPFRALGAFDSRGRLLERVDPRTPS